MRTISTIQRILLSAYEIGLEGMLNLHTLGTYPISKQITSWEPAVGEAGENFQKEILCFFFFFGYFKEEEESFEDSSFYNQSHLSKM